MNAGANAVGASARRAPSPRRRLLREGGDVHVAPCRRWAAALALASVVLALFGVAAGLWTSGMLLPRWVTWNDAELACDLDADGAFEAISLQGRQVSVYEGGELACRTPAGWFVSDLAVRDLDADGSQEIVCLAWKRGSYGESRPFWVARNTAGFSQHVFIFSYRAGGLAHKWMSSDIGMKATSMQVDALGRLSFDTVEGERCLCEWQSWGLTYLDGQTASKRDALADAAVLVAAGDVIPHDGLLEQAKAKANTSAKGEGAAGKGEGEGAEASASDFSGLFSGVTDLVREADVAAMNVEAPIAADDDEVDGTFPDFAAPPSLADAVADAGFDVALAANNHILDKGEEGLDQTIDYWDEAHPDVALLGVSGAGEEGEASVVRIVERNGVRIALLDATDVMNGEGVIGDGAGGIGGSNVADGSGRVCRVGDGSGLASAVAAAEAQADVVVCFLHLGEEYAQDPDAEAEELASRLVDAGADAVVCSHPHVVQRAERISTQAGNSGYVCYSLGNLAASQPYPETALGAMCQLVLAKPADGSEAYVSGCYLVPTVCHVEAGDARVCLLQDYAAAEAGRHYLDVSLPGLRRQWLSAI